MPNLCAPQEGVCHRTLLGRAFAQCSTLVDPAVYVVACTQDLCRCPTCPCATFAEYSRQCAHAGGQPRNWRGPDLCREWSQTRASPRPHTHMGSQGMGVGGTRPLGRKSGIWLGTRDKGSQLGGWTGEQKEYAWGTWEAQREDPAWAQQAELTPEARWAQGGCPGGIGPQAPLPARIQLGARQAGPSLPR